MCDKIFGDFTAFALLTEKRDNFDAKFLNISIHPPYLQKKRVDSVFHYGGIVVGITKKMKTSLNLLLVGFLVCALQSDAQSQTAPRLKINRNTPSSALVNWTNQVGTSYHVFFSTNLAKPFSILEDAFSPDELVSVYASTAETPLGFFRIQVPTNSTTAAVQIFSPSNAVTVSGEISIRMGAQLGREIQGVNLYLDNALVGYLNSGGMNFSLETTHFANGSHTVYVGAVDTANNETISSSIALNFNNPVRWLDACSMFNSFVPINVDSDIYPADWLVSVTDTNGTIVRTITGSTTDGIIQTSWDGTDDNAQLLPVENLYQITVDVNETTSSSSMKMASSLASTLSSPATSSKLNSHGVLEFTLQKSAPNPLAEYEETLKVYRQLTPQEKIIYPPLPARPANNPVATTKSKLSARDMFLTMQNNSSALLSATKTPTPYGASALRSGSTKDLVWWENPWGSGQTLLAYAGDLGLIQSGYASSAMTGVRNLINTLNDDIGGNRGTYNNAIYTVSSAADFSNLTNHLTETTPNNVRAFYFYGHGNTNGNAFGTQSRVIGARSLSLLLGNYIAPSPTGKPTLVTHHAYSFVYLDGCNTAIGNLPEAFGIPKAVTGLQLNAAGLHKRAFMGWGAEVTHTMVTNYELAWSQKFWQVWLGDGADATVALKTAIDAAEAYHSGVTNDFKLRIYGNKDDLTWGE